MVAITIRRAALAAAMLGLVVGAADQASAELVINFDDVHIPTSVTAVLIPNPYQGFNWSNFYVTNESYLQTLNKPPLLASGVVSPGQQAAYNGSAQPATLMSTGGATFDLTSAYLTSFKVLQPDMPQTVRVQGFLQGVPITADDITYNITNLANLAPTLFTFNFTGIDTAMFTGSSNNSFVMDNLSVSFSAVPELDSLSTASALTLLTSGMLILNGRRKR